MTIIQWIDNMKQIIYTLLMLSCGYAFADGTESDVAVNNNAKYIAPNNYLQNPYGALTSGGGIQVVSESQMAQQNFAERLFADGTWNVMAGAAGAYFGTDSGASGYHSIGYGANLFGQTGSVAGFSVGGLFSAANPFYSTQINGDANGHNVNGANFNFLPANKQVTLSEAYLEYQHSNVIQADIGYIGINNSPWLTSNYYSNVLTPGANYQGALVNVYPGGGWLLTALAFNGAQLIGNTGFTPGTFYNTGVDYSSGSIVNTVDELSNGTVAVGANYAAWNNQYNLRLWGYQFDNYGTLLYADNTIKFQPTKALGFTIGAQAGTDNQLNNGTNAILNDGMGQISSNFVGLQGGFSYDWFSLSVGYNNVWGPSSAYGSGAIVTPYTYGFATDPLYTTPYMAGLADLGTAGQAYKFSPSFNFLDGNLSIAPAWTSFVTADPNWNGTNEYDFVVTYNIPQVKGLTLFGVYAYQQVPEANQNGSGNVTQLFISYLY